MVKQRFNSIDIASVVKTLRSDLKNMRLSNVYDVNAKTYLFKFSQPSGKAFLVIESGIRIHLTKFTQDKSQMPSQFTTKLRKHCRTKRLESVRQLGTDRVIHITFGNGEAANHLIVELYAKGNIILTDHNGRILTLLRSYKYDEEYEVKVGNLFRFVDGSPMASISEPQLREALAAAKPKQTLIRALNQKFSLGNQLIEHCLLLAGLPPKRHPSKEPLDDQEIALVLENLLLGLEIYSKIKDGEETSKGYIVLKEEPEFEGKGEDVSSLSPAEQLAVADRKRTAEVALYEDFVPYCFTQLKEKCVLEFDTFDEAADQFFSATGLKKQLKEVGQRDKQIDKKVANAKRQQETRLAKLKEKEEKLSNQAQLIEYNLDSVDQAITIIRSGVAAGMDWDKLDGVVKQEQANGNEIASLISSLDLKNDCIVLMLSNPYDEDQAPEKVTVNIGESAYANARKVYEDLKDTRRRREKTAEVADEAIKRAGAHAERTVKAVRNKVTIQTLRKVYWWEKFDWFISTDGYLVIAGRDAQQNELLVKRYMRPNDRYVHAELHGASSCIVKNHDGATEIPQATLEQAGHMTVCRSAAWKAKVSSDAWWVFPNQVSKTAPAGEYLVTGSFMIRGKKNMIPAPSLVMGLGVMFCLGQSSIDARRAKYGDLYAAGQDKEKDEDAPAGPEPPKEAAPKEAAERGAGDEDGSEEEDSEEELLDLGDRYKLTISSEVTDADVSTQQYTRSKPRMSKAERARLKAGRDKIPQPAPKQKKEAASAQPQKNVRGKHGKNKKIATKYRHQTEEERAENVRILQSAGKVEEDEDEESVEEEVAPGLAEFQAEIANEKGGKEGRKGRKAREREEVAAILEEEKIALASEQMKGDANELAALTGAPAPTDELRSAVVVCAPWSALVSFKYKVKLVPADKVKKGKAAKSCVSAWLRTKNETAREIELIQGVPDNEIMGTMLANAQQPQASGNKKGGPKKGKAGARRHKGANKRKNRK